MPPPFKRNEVLIELKELDPSEVADEYTWGIIHASLDVACHMHVQHAVQLFSSKFKLPSAQQLLIQSSCRSDAKNVARL